MLISGCPLKSLRKHHTRCALAACVCIGTPSLLASVWLQAVSNSLWAYAKLAYNPGRPVLDATVHRAVHSLPQFTSQEVANTLWALATLEHHPGVQLLDACAIQIARRMEQFSPQDNTNSVWAYAKLYHCPCNDLLQSAAIYCLRHWHR